ncbi:transposase, partial [Streptomyces sp. NWU339]|uniref:transposase n=1 Tax=Streptomyces sp. NWU339 TaxID=2185284 RepID=UPI00215A617D
TRQRIFASRTRRRRGTGAGRVDSQYLAGEKEPAKYWLSALPAHVPLRRLVRLAKIRWRVEHDYRELKTALGLGHFEGRTYQGFLRHLSLASVAQAFCTLERLCPPASATV